MAKDPTPRADALQAMRESRYGHLQATAPTPNEAAMLAAMPRKLIPYAGKSNAGGPRAPVDRSPEAVAARKAVAAKRKPRKKKEKTS